jgi:hypothetical protein
MYSEETCSGATFSATNPNGLGSRQNLRSATNSLSQGTTPARTNTIISYVIISLSTQNRIGSRTLRTCAYGHAFSQEVGCRPLAAKVCVWSNPAPVHLGFVAKTGSLGEALQFPCRSVSFHVLSISTPWSKTEVMLPVILATDSVS